MSGPELVLHVAAVLRRCFVCSKWKPLESYPQTASFPGRKQGPRQKVCAACKWRESTMRNNTKRSKARMEGVA